MENIRFGDLKEYVISKESKDTKVTITGAGRITFNKHFLEKYPDFCQNRSANIYYSAEKNTLVIRFLTIESDEAVPVRQKESYAWINARKIIQSFHLSPKDINGMYADKFFSVEGLGECLVLEIPHDALEKAIERVLSTDKEHVDTESQDYNSY